MKVRKSWKSLGVAAVMALACASAPADSITSIASLGTITPMGISADGQILSGSLLIDTKSGQTTNIGLNTAGGISANGTVTTSGWTGTDAGVRQVNGSIQDAGNLGDQLGEAGNSTSYGVNDSGTVVGQSRATLRTERAWVSFVGPSSDPGRHSVDLYGLGGYLNTSVATAINNAGTIVGQGDTPTSGSHAFMVASPFSTNPPGSGSYTTSWPTDLGTLGGKDSFASAINNAGVVVGASNIHDDQSQFVKYTTDATGTNEAVHAFVYDPTVGKMTDLGTLPGYKTSFAAAINDKGQIVGTASDQEIHIDGSRAYYAANLPGNTRAFLYENGTMTDLNALLPKDSGWLLQSALGINNAGQVIGTGLYEGQAEGYVLSLSSDPIQAAPVPEPTTLAFFGMIVACVAGRAASRKRWAA